jgi:hypothetical protein
MPAVPGSSAGGAAVAEYLVRRNEDGTVTPMLVVGTDFMTFGVDGTGNITAACPGGAATDSVYGH